MPVAGPGARFISRPSCLKAKTGIKITIVNYRGAGPALNDLLGGHIDGMFDAMPVMVAAGQGGQGHAARGHQHHAFAGIAQRADDPRVGLCPDYEMSGWFGILAPAGTPPAIAQRLRDEVAKAVAAAGRRFDAGLARHGAACYPATRNGPTT